jgi:hypothetical protein
MEIENKWEAIDKEPEVGDLVMYKCQSQLLEGLAVPSKPDLGLVTQTYNQGFEGDDLESAYVMWSVDDRELELFSDLAVVSSGSIIYDS